MEEIFGLINHQRLTLFMGVLLVVNGIVTLAIFVDLWDGVYTARLMGERIHSHKLRKTIAKICEYWRFIIIGFFFDVMCSLFGVYSKPFAAILFGLALLYVEGKSMFEHARRRKSHTSELPDLLRRIISAANEKDAKKIVEFITDLEKTKESE